MCWFCKGCNQDYAKENSQPKKKSGRQRSNIVSQAYLSASPQAQAALAHAAAVRHPRAKGNPYAAVNKRTKASDNPAAEIAAIASESFDPLAHLTKCDPVSGARQVGRAPRGSEPLLWQKPSPQDPL